jgi:archaellum component FlaC
MDKDYSELIQYLDGRFTKIDTDLDVLKETKANKKDVQDLVNSIDRLAKSMEIYRDEYVALTSKVDKHEKWFQQVADKLGLKLEY